MNLNFTRECQASYGVDDPEFAVTQLAQTTMRSEVGKISLDTVFKEREQLNVSIVGRFRGIFIFLVFLPDECRSDIGEIHALRRDQ